MKRLALFLFLIFSVSSVMASVNGALFSNGKLPNIFLECRWCSDNFIKEKITFVNFVRDRLEADIHIFTTRRRTGSGGHEYSLIFIGQKRLKGLRDTLKYYTNRTDTYETSRKKLIRKLKLGLVRFLYKSPIADNFKISYKGNGLLKNKEYLNDYWNYWVFRTALHFFTSGEKTSKFSNINASFSASRITEKWKFFTYFNNEYDENNYNYNNVNITNIKRSQRFYLALIKSVTAHWSLGSWLISSSSTYKNIDFSIAPGLGVEYNYFPYSQSNSRELIFQFKIFGKYNNYADTTIYNKTEEYLAEQKLVLGLGIIKEWGRINGSVVLSSYLHDLNKNSAKINLSLNLKLFEGLSLDLSGQFKAIHNQIELPLENASLEEVLLQRKELATQYSYFASVGFSYTFGSIYNNIVNTRFNF